MLRILIFGLKNKQKSKFKKRIKSKVKEFQNPLHKHLTISEILIKLFFFYITDSI